MQNDMCKNSGFCSRIQKSYKKSGIESKNLIIFSESIPNLYPLCLSLSHTDRTDLTGFLCGWEILWMLSNPLLPRAHTDHTDHTDLTGFLCGWEISRRLYGLWFFVDSRRFREIQREDDLWKFV